MSKYYKVTFIESRKKKEEKTKKKKTLTKGKEKLNARVRDNNLVNTTIPCN
jgi:hypothetical protein